MDNGASSYRRFLEGDESGFDELLDLYQHNLIFFINWYVHNVTVAEDLAEDSFLELLIHKHRYNFKTSLKTYLFTIGRNKALNYLKRQSKFPIVTIESTNNEATNTITLEEHILCDERKRMLNSAMKELSNEYRTAIYLVHFEGLSYKETAKIMNKNPKQIENLLFRAKGLLKTTLIKEGISI